MSKIKLEDHGYLRKLLFDEEFCILGFKYKKEYETLQSSAYLEKLLKYKRNIKSIIHILERFQNPHFIYSPLLHMIYDYIGPAELNRIGDNNSIVIDYGSGYGTSTLILSKIFPKAKIIGLESSKERVELSNILTKDINLNGFVNFFHVTKNNLKEIIMNNPPSIPMIVLNAVIEHIHPDERQEIIETLYSFLEPGGYLVILGTPNSLFPIENHTTQLPIIPYLPINLKFKFAKLLRRKYRKTTKEHLIFEGIVGSSIIEVKKILNKNFSNNYSILKPKRSIANTWFIDRLNKGFNIYKLLPLFLVYKFLDLFKINIIYVLTELQLVIKKEK